MEVFQFDELYDGVDLERELEGPEQPDLWVWGLTVRFFLKICQNFRKMLLVFGCIVDKI